MVTVVIPLYNKQDTIKSAISSVLNQTFQQFELLVINDGSSDNSVSEVLSFDDPRIKLVNKTNGGVSEARNMGLSLAVYDYVAFLDADDTWKEDFLEELLTIIAKYPDFCLYGSRQIQVSSNNKSALSDTIGGESIYIFRNHDYFKVASSAILFHTSAIIVNRLRLKRHHISFNTNLTRGEDLDFYFRIALADNMLFYNKALTCYNLDVDGSLMHVSCKFNKRLIGNIGYYKSYMDNDEIICRFFSHYILSCIPLLLNDKVSSSDISKVESLINFKVLSFRDKIYFSIPNILKLFVYKFYHKILSFY